MNDLILESGNPYSLSELFSGDSKIIVPDMQRDYCWGDKNNESLVLKFLESLFESFEDNKNTELQLGMIYAYESPKNHIQLCDGQQRLTTLYLLMGLLHKKINSNSLKDCLISTFEWENDDKECRLQYAIRESTLYFLNDLVDNCFINHQEISIIKKQSWYFNEYDLDPTIQSMINALGIIEKEISKKTPPQYLNDFTGFLLEKVKLLYFNMENRKRGEEMFVIINTTGEPLTPTENLKPKLIGLIENVETSELKSNEWEERETFFWSNRKKEEQEADDGVNEFLVWFAKIHFKKEETNLFKDISADSLDSVNGYFDSLKKLLRVTANNENIRTILGFIEPISSTNEKDVLHYYRNLKFY